MSGLVLSSLKFQLRLLAQVSLVRKQHQIALPLLVSRIFPPVPVGLLCSCNCFVVYSRNYLRVVVQLLSSKALQSDEVWRNVHDKKRLVLECPGAKVAYTAYWGLFILWETRRVSQPALLEDWEVQDGSRTNSGQTSELKNFSAFGSAHMLEGQATLVRDALSYVRLSAAN